MSSITPDAVRAEIVENALVAGNPVKTSAKIKAVASMPMYVDSSSNFASGALPFSMPINVTSVSTTATFLTLTGNSSLSGSADMTLTLVAGSAVTTVTKAAFIRVTLSDSAGNITAGDYYIQLNTLS